jgi:hypothetical protein
VPEALVPTLQTWVEDYKSRKIEGLDCIEDTKSIEMTDRIYLLLNKTEVIEKSKQIIKRKKSAKISLEILLKYLYGSDISMER